MVRVGYGENGITRTIEQLKPPREALLNRRSPRENVGACPLIHAVLSLYVTTLVFSVRDQGSGTTVAEGACALAYTGRLSRCVCVLTSIVQDNDVIQTGGDVDDVTDAAGHKLSLIVQLVVHCVTRAGG